MGKRIDVATLPALAGTLYPSPFDEPCGPGAARGLPTRRG